MKFISSPTKQLLFFSLLAFICLSSTPLYPQSSTKQMMKQIMERNWQGICLPNTGALKGFKINLELTNVSFNSENGRFKAIIQKTLFSKQGTFYDVSEYTGSFNPPYQLTFEHNKVIRQDELPFGAIWPNYYFSANMSEDPQYKGHYVLMDDVVAHKIVFTTYRYRK